MSIAQKRTPVLYTVCPRQQVSFSLEEPSEFMGTIGLVSGGQYRRSVYFTVHGSFFVKHTHTFQMRLDFEAKLKEHAETWWLTTEDGEGKPRPHALRINYRSRYRKLLVRAQSQVALAGVNA